MLIVFATRGLPFDDDSIERGGLGGSESALIYLARELARRGHEVRVFCDGPKRAAPAIGRYGAPDSLWYAPISELYEFNKIHRFDVFICCRFWSLLYRQIWSRLTIAWSHDMPDMQALAPAMWQVDRLAVLSDFHASEYLKQSPELEPLLLRTRNGVDMEAVRRASWSVLRDKPLWNKTPGRLIYTSRPERGLLYLLRDIFPRVLKERPDATLAIAGYDVSALVGIPAEVIAVTAECNRLADALGDRVVNLGSLSKPDLYREIAQAEVWAYPCCFPEISCIAAMEAQACGTWVVSTADFALTETVGHAVKVGVPGDGEFAHYDESGHQDNAPANAKPFKGPTGDLIQGLPASADYVNSFVKKALDVLNPLVIDRAAMWDQDRTFGPHWIESQGFHWRSIAAQWEAEIDRELSKPSHRQTIACCMIVRNEEANLYRCLKSVRPFVDELHIVDTGSTDRTLEIADQFNPTTTHSLPFTDFSTARNASTRWTDADWILWIDADEVLVNGEVLRAYTCTRYFEGYVLAQRHLQADAGTIQDPPIRLYRNRDHYQFTGIIHEHAEDTSKGPFDNQIGPAYMVPDVYIVHYGYPHEAVRREKVSNRNLALMGRALIEQPARQLTWALALRDLVLVPRWHFDAGGKIENGDPRHEMLCRCVDEWLSRFSDESHKYHAITYPFYQDALKLLASCGLPCAGRDAPPFAVAFGMHGGRREDAKPKLDAARRWWPDSREFTKFVMRSAAKLVNGLGAAGDPAPSAIIPGDGHRIAELFSIGTGIVPARYFPDQIPPPIAAKQEPALSA